MNQNRENGNSQIVKYIFQFSNLATKTDDFIIEVDARVDMQLDFIRGCNGSGAKSLSAIVANSIAAKFFVTNVRERERERERVTWIDNAQHQRRRRHLCGDWWTLKWKLQAPKNELNFRE